MPVCSICDINIPAKWRIRLKEDTLIRRYACPSPDHLHKAVEAAFNRAAIEPSVVEITLCK